MCLMSHIKTEWEVKGHSSATLKPTLWEHKEHAEVWLLLILKPASFIVS